jgi:hypothetical protein
MPISIDKFTSLFNEEGQIKIEHIQRWAPLKVSNNSRINSVAFDDGDWYHIFKIQETEDPYKLKIENSKCALQKLPSRDTLSVEEIMEKGFSITYKRDSKVEATIVEGKYIQTYGFSKVNDQLMLDYNQISEVAN